MSMVHCKIVNLPVEAVTSMTTTLGLHKASMNIYIGIGCCSQADRQETNPYINWIFSVV